MRTLADWVKKHDKVSYCVIDKGVKAPDSWWYTFKSVIVFGKIKTITDEDEKIRYLQKCKRMVSFCDEMYSQLSSIG